MSRLAPTTLEFISLGSIWHRNTKHADTISHSLRPAQPVTVTPQTSSPSSHPFKVHSLPPPGAASFKSLYPKRPFKPC